MNKFKPLIDMFKKKTKHKITSVTITAGTDLDGKKCIDIQEVDGIKCICVHKCKVIDGLHYTKMNEESLELAIPYEPLIPLLDRL